MTRLAPLELFSLIIFFSFLIRFLAFQFCVFLYSFIIVDLLQQHFLHFSSFARKNKCAQASWIDASRYCDRCALANTSKKSHFPSFLWAFVHKFTFKSPLHHHSRKKNELGFIFGCLFHVWRIHLHPTHLERKKRKRENWCGFFVAGFRVFQKLSFGYVMKFGFQANEVVKPGIEITALKSKLRKSIFNSAPSLFRSCNARLIRASFRRRLRLTKALMCLCTVQREKGTITFNKGGCRKILSQTYTKCTSVQQQLYNTVAAANAKTFGPNTG